ncbi:hypothetical protein SAMN05192574_101490 [Mucilaginibacter gossypiicola]|uniref:Uncharacterized protein n=1 Tax=Mucilaginibacter gossypiicola TaxID=551995 RepID=A0A1H8AEV9_9SPHI|nr:hypothetical protein [Mucilaginibacter gossypiicola]SEM69270.1 hypothetical protein SAMN05192574_101490 [Mucilaginibacter gossypiicola]
MPTSEQNPQSSTEGTTPNDALKNDAAGQPDNPQLSAKEQFTVVALVVSAMIISMFIIIAWWPADPTTNKNALYLNKPFHVRPIAPAGNETKSADGKPKATVADTIVILTKKLAEQQKHSETLAKDTNPDSVKALEVLKKVIEETQNALKKLKDKQEALEHICAAKCVRKECPGSSEKICTIQLGNLLLILVAAAGFLGNLIHVSRSLTFYIGMKRFQRSWYPWYIIKPFTASGLALLIYFATNGTSGSGTTDQGAPINLTAIMLTAGLVGLFTDIATQKLKVIFEAILKPADTHSGAGNAASPQPAAKAATVDMNKVSPEKIDAKGVNHVKIPGQNLNLKNLIITINNQVIDKSTITITATEISFDYAPADATATEFVLSVKDAAANLDAKKTWTIV